MITVRDYRASDAAALASIFHRSVQIGAKQHYTAPQLDDWSPECPASGAYQERLEGLRVFVAQVAGDPVGFMALRESDGYIDLAFVAPEMIGKGVAFALYGRVRSLCRDLGLSRMTVEASAQSYVFFSRQGWSVTGRKTRGSGKTELQTWLMDKQL